MKKILLILGFSLFFPVSAFAAGDPSQTAMALVEKCSQIELMRKDKEYSQFDAGVCAGIIQGIFDFNTINQRYGGQPYFCLGEGVSILQAAKVYIAFMDRNPQALNRNQSVTMLSSLVEAFPCSSN